jgi:ribosome-binding protein aMBF1 (putative translation factor)
MSSNTLALEIEQLEDQWDAAEARLAGFENANEERVSWDVVRRMHRGENPITVWRELRGYSIEELADRAKVDPSVVAALESNEAAASVRVFRQIAQALDVMIENLVPWSQD